MKMKKNQGNLENVNTVIELLSKDLADHEEKNKKFAKKDKRIRRRKKNVKLTNPR